MNLLRLAWKNIIHKPLNTLLSLVLFGLGIGLISLLFLLDHQLQQNFEKNLAEVDLVIGAKGSPLQMILSSMYHIDAPTGNISLQEIRPFLNPNHPLIKEALPISLGDSYRGFRIVGTTKTVLDWYNLEVDRGSFVQHDFDVTIGAQVARTLQMSEGDRFKSSHGLADAEGLEHDDAHDFKVVGILAPSGTVMDQLILTTPQTYWSVHSHEEEGDDEHDDHDHEKESDAGHDDHDHDHSGHDGHSHNETATLLDEDGEEEITNVLLRFKGRNFQALNMQRSINENTDLQAATPAIEINRLFSMMNDAERVLRLLAFVIVFVSGLSIFISLFSSLKERKYELSIMRVMGGTRRTLFFLLIMEGLILAIIGFVLGILLSHITMEAIGTIMSADYRYDFNGRFFLKEELWLLSGAVLLGILASVIPAIQASRTDISDTLSKG